MPPIRALAALVAALLAAGCREEGAGTEEPQAAVSPAPAAGGAPDATATAGSASRPEATPGIETPAPQIAYSYSLQFRLPAARLAGALDAHVALCDAMGPARCRIVSLGRSGEEGEFLTASLQLQVAAAEARGLADRMEATVADAGGRTIGRGQQAEDLGRQIVDVEARIAAKQQLADRLRALIDRPAAKVGELVEAERAFAEAQAELDSARSQLEMMRRQIAMSRIEANYQSREPEGSGALAPIRSAIAESGQMLGASVGAVFTFLVLALPWAIAALVLVWAARRWRWRRDLSPPPPAD